MKNKVYKRLCTLVFSILMCACNFSVSATEAYNAYTYDSWGNTVDVPNGYKTSSCFGSGNNIKLKAPMDMYLRNDILYVLDTGNNRVVMYGKDHTVKGVIDEFYIVENGEQKITALNEPQGIFISPDNRIYIADTANQRVIICEKNGHISQILTKPQTKNFPDSLQYKPIKVVVNDIGNIYVLADGFYYGAIVYDANGNYKNLFGASKVKVSASLIADRFWRKFMTQKQLDYARNYLPSTFTSFDIDGKNFIYTVTADKQGAIRKLNFLGNDIFAVEKGPDPIDKSVYGDRISQFVGGAWYSTSFVDIAVSEEDFVFVLDRTNGRVFQYDKDSNLINIFGANGNQKGTFKTAVAVETDGRDVFVLDQDKAQITLFSPTDYGNLISDATVLYHQGLFDKAFDKWQLVLSYNSNCDLAYRGIGRAYLQQGKYTEAMKYARLGQDRIGYSKAYRFHRSETAKKYFIPVVCALIFLIIIVALVKKSVVTKRNFGVERKKPFLFKPVTIMFHSVTFFEKLQVDKSIGTLFASFVVVALFFVGQVISSLATGFVFNQNNITEFNAFFVTAQSLGFVAIWVLSDAVVGSLRFGHATVRGVFCGTAASLVPYTITIYLNIVLSHFLVYEEKGIMAIITTVGLLYTVFLIYQSVRISQKYSVVEALGSILLDILVAIIVILLVVIVYMLVRQILIFAATLWQEIAYRIN